MRCYNGCPDSALQAFLDDQRKASEELAAIGCHATYFPMEEKWVVFKGNRPITPFLDTKRAAADAALAEGRAG